MRDLNAGGEGGVFYEYSDDQNQTENAYKQRTALIAKYIDEHYDTVFMTAY